MNKIWTWGLVCVLGLGSVACSDERSAEEAGRRVDEAVQAVRQELPPIPEVEKFASFIAESPRGVCR